MSAFVKSLIQDLSADHQKDELIEAFHRRLRHDLRTPLNAIKGYSELLIEDLDADATHPLRLDLIKVKESADQLLGQIDAVAALARGEESRQPSTALARSSSILLPTYCARLSRCAQMAPAKRCSRAAF